MRIAVLTLSLFSTMAASAQTPLDGKALFTQRCSLCHQAEGGGTWMLGRRLGADKALLESRTDLQPAYIRLVVRAGIASMPRFTRVDVSDAELDAIAAYLAKRESKS
jgi:mono/diheme cytochrome c family protein